MVRKLKHSGPEAAIGFKGFGHRFACAGRLCHLWVLWEAPVGILPGCMGIGRCELVMLDKLIFVFCDFGPACGGLFMPRKTGCFPVKWCKGTRAGATPPPPPRQGQEFPVFGTLSEPYLQNETIQEKWGEIGGKGFFLFLMGKWETLGPKPPKMHFLLGDVMGGAGNSHSPPLGHKGKWGEMGGNGGN